GRVRRARDRRWEPPLECARRRPGQADAVLVVGTDAPVQDRVGGIGRVARVRSGVRGQVVNRSAEAGVLRDLNPVASRSFRRRPLEGRLVEELRAVGGAHASWWCRLLLKALSGRGQGVAYGRGAV